MTFAEVNTWEETRNSMVVEVAAMEAVLMGATQVSPVHCSRKECQAGCRSKRKTGVSLG